MDVALAKMLARRLLRGWCENKQLVFFIQLRNIQTAISSADPNHTSKYTADRVKTRF